MGEGTHASNDGIRPQSAASGHAASDGRASKPVRGRGVARKSASSADAGERGVPVRATRRRGATKTSSSTASTVESERAREDDDGEWEGSVERGETTTRWE